METPKMQEKKVSLDIDTTELSPAQVRQIKTLVSLIYHVTQTDQEKEYFNGSAEVMRIFSSLMKQGNVPLIHA